MSAALLPLATVKTLLGITGSAEDAKLTAALPVITEYFENHCKRGLAYVADVIEEFALTYRLALFRFPIEDVTELLIDGVVTAPPLIDSARGFIRMGYETQQVAKVTYAGGYAEADVPADLAMAYARCCADFGGVTYVSAGGAGGAPLKSLGLGSGALTVAFDTGAASASYDTSSVPPVLAPYLFVLDHYRVKDYV